MSIQSRHIRALDRKGTGSLKWDHVDEFFSGNDLLPMWVADTDWPIPNEVEQALRERVSHPIFGYSGPSQSLYNAVQSWIDKKHNWEIHQDDIIFSPGVVPSIAAAVMELTKEGDPVLIQTPVYTPFFNVIKNNNRELRTNELKMNGPRFEIDFEDFESQLKKGVKLFILCSPHNPGGTVWRKNELERIVQLCDRYQVPIISDEIHSDLLLYKHAHTPLGKLGKNVITLMAPSKTFNIAGLQGSLVISKNKQLLQAMATQFEKMGLHGINTFAYTAMEACYRYGAPWLEQICTQIEENVALTEAYLNEEIPGIRVIKPEASFLVWLDLRELGYSDEEISKRLIEKGQLALNTGPSYGKGGSGFVRLNIGCSTETLKEGLKRLSIALRE